MKHKKILASTASTVVLGASMLPANVFAADNFGINYTGGTELSGQNVTIDPTLVGSLKPLMQAKKNVSVSVTGDGWKTGYESHSGECLNVRYFKVPKEGVQNSNLGLSFSSGEYRADVKINSAEVGSVEDELDGGKGFSISVVDMSGHDNSFIFGGHAIYSDDKCTTRVADMAALSKDRDNKAFVSMNVKLHKKDSNAVFTAKDLYFGIVDIDAGQSYKILNPNNQLTKDNMFAESERALQFDIRNNGGCELEDESCTDYKNPDGLLNRYVSNENGSYIYSDYQKNAAEGHAGTVLSPEASNILVKIQQETQEQGLNIVFGFSSTAGSGIEYYAQQYNVTYASDENGKIPDGALTSETLISGDIATGSKVEPKDGYTFSHWVADVDVTLTDGKTIKAGDPITDEELKQVVVDKDIAFTAVNETLEPEDGEEPEDEEEGGVVAVPDTGASTKDINAILIPASILGILVGALIIRALPRLLHKKVNFNK